MESIERLVIWRAKKYKQPYYVREKEMIRGNKYPLVPGLKGPLIASQYKDWPHFKY